ncbi:unnamed protein product [Cercopithifilaria johnstoni]|uniref:Uncharacterized protein n=1 Tax=Cercopithifilaria johnstoni TaxID=2874296 RepID=A0A8J2M5Y0_9BILA|nr:unnamed protein product [Cercopithifilaria johnstoni]
MPVLQLPDRTINTVEMTLISFITLVRHVEGHLQMYLNFIKTMMLMLIIISEKNLWKNAKSLVGSCMDKKHLSIFTDNFVGAAEIITDYELPVPVKHLKRQLVEEEMKSYATILLTSAVIVALITFICLIIMLHIFIYMRWGITRQLILLNAKVCALESRLGTRQLPEELQRRLCEEIGITFKTVQNERQKFAQEVANELVKTENEAQYETMCGIGDEIFTTKKQDEKNVPKAAPAQSLPPKKQIEGLAIAVTQQDKIKAPKIGGMVDYADPKYQTLVGMDNEKVFAEKKAPTVGGMADHADPAYQTLFGMKNANVFQRKGK